MKILKAKWLKRFVRSKRNRDAMVADIVLILFFVAWASAITWVVYNHTHKNSQVSYLQYIGRLRVSYKPSNLYAVKTEDGSSYLLSTDQLMKDSSDCQPGNNPIGSFTQIDKSSLPDQTNSLTEQGLHGAAGSGSVKEYNDHFLVFNGPQASCSTNGAIAQQQIQDTQTAKQVFESVK